MEEGMTKKFKIFLSQGKYSWRSRLVLLKVCCLKKLCVTVTVFLQISLSHSTKTTSRGSLFVFLKIPGPDIFHPYDGLSQFVVRILVSHHRKFSLKEHFDVCVYLLQLGITALACFKVIFQGKQIGQKPYIRGDLEANSYKVRTKVSFLVREAPTKNWQKISILIRVERNNLSTFKITFIKYKM